MKPVAYIVVESGSPYEKGAYVPILQPSFIVGRKGKEWLPDLAFSNIFVSRKHLAITQKNGKFYIKDLDSKHGTSLNNRPLKPNEEIPLQDTDTITIANDLIKFSFSSSNMELTAELAPTLQILKTMKERDITLDPIKQELIIQRDSFPFTEKEYKCIEILANNIDQFVSIEEIKSHVWNERLQEDQECPDVSSDEMNALIYRIRKKIHPHLQIENIRGKGYILNG